MDADSKGDGRFHFQVKNTFLDVQTDEDVQRRTFDRHARSKSWDGSTSSSSVSCSGTGDSENEHNFGASVHGRGRQEFHHWVVQTNSSASASVTDSAGEPAAQTYRDFVWELETGQRSPEHTPAEVQPESEDGDFQPEYGQSIGSKGHGRGKCTPCTRILVRPGCEYGSRCMFCHLEHSAGQMDSKKNRHRPCKAARQQYKQTIQKIHEEYKDKPEQKQKALGKIADASPYMRSLLRGLDGQGEEEMEEPNKSSAASSSEMPRVPGLQPAGPATSSAQDRKTLISL